MAMHRRRSRKGLASAREKSRRDGSTKLTTAGAMTVARQSRPPYQAPTPVLADVLVAEGDRFDVADAAALPWPNNSVDLLVNSPPYALDIEHVGGDVQSYSEWLQLLEKWLSEMSRVSRAEGGRLCLNVPLDRDLGGWEPVSADVLQTASQWVASEPGLSGQRPGRGTDRVSFDSASAPNVTAAVESVLVLYRGEWRRPSPASMPHKDGWNYRHRVPRAGFSLPAPPEPPAQCRVPHWRLTSMSCDGSSNGTRRAGHRAPRRPAPLQSPCD
jgi:hypothetical protein